MKKAILTLFSLSLITSTTWAKPQAGFGEKISTLNSVFDLKQGPCASQPAKTCIYALSNFPAALFVSEDEGQSWNLIKKIDDASEKQKLNSPLFFKLTVTGPDSVLIAASSGIIKIDTQRGDAEIVLHSKTAVNDIRTSPHDARTVLAGGFAGLYISDDRGETWKNISTLQDFIDDQKSKAATYIDAVKAKFSCIENAYKTKAKAQLQKSEPGSTFSAQEIANAAEGNIFRDFFPFTTHNVTSVQFDPEDSRILYAGTGNHLYFSQDGGQNWQIILGDMRVDTSNCSVDESASVHNDSTVYNIDFDSDRRATFTTCNGVYYVNMNKGIDKVLKYRSSTFYDQTDLLKYNLRSYIVLRQSKNILIGADKGIYSSKDDGKNWIKIQGVPGSKSGAPPEYKSIVWLQDGTALVGSERQGLFLVKP